MTIKTWIPLESNPEVLTKLIQKMGVDTSQVSFQDVLGLDQELLSMVPQPVLAVIMCYPITDESEAAQKKEDDAVKAANDGAVPPGPATLYYMKQTIGNACGTIAVLHGLGNNTATIKPAAGSFLEHFFRETLPLDPPARGKYLEDPPEGAPNVEETHQAAGREGNTKPPAEDEEVSLHYVAFVHVDGKLWELDGRRAGPLEHGPTTPDALLADAAKVVQQFVMRSNSLSFNLLALCGVGAE